MENTSPQISAEILTNPGAWKKIALMLIFSFSTVAFMILFFLRSAIQNSTPPANLATPASQPEDPIPQTIKNPPVIGENRREIYKGTPFKLSSDPNSHSQIFARVEKLTPHPQNSDEYILYLSGSAEAAGIPFVIRPIYLDEREMPGRRTFIYFARSVSGQLKQIKAEPKDLIPSFPVIVTYKIKEPSEVFAVSVAIQENLIK